MAQKSFKDFHIVKGDFDQDDAPEKKMIQIGDFNIGLIHGHQVLPWGDLESLGMVQRSLGCDILISGHTHKTNVVVKDNILYINPGSFSGAFSPLIEDTIPSFVLMVLTGDEAIVYLYTLSDRSKKFEVNKYDYKKGADNLFHVENEEDEEEKKEEEDDLDKKDENQQEQEQEAEPEQEQEQNEIKDVAE